MVLAGGMMHTLIFGCRTFHKQGLPYLSLCHRLQSCMARPAGTPWSCSIATNPFSCAPCWGEMSRYQSLGGLRWTAAPAPYR